MLKFEFKNPTKIRFGKGQIENLAKEIPAKAKVMMLYGGGSIKKNGIYEQIKNALKDFEVIEFGGIPANPEYEILMQALSIQISNVKTLGLGTVSNATKIQLPHHVMHHASPRHCVHDAMMR